MGRKILGIVSVILSFAAPAISRAQAPQGPGLDLSRLSDAELDRRIGFIEERLDRERNGAAWWQWGWAGFHIASTGYSIAIIASSDDRKDRRQSIVDAVQSAGAVGYGLFAPHPAWRGADPVREMPSSTRAEREAQLAAAEERLHDSAEHADLPYTLMPHAINLVTNLVAGGIIWGIADRAHAARSTIPGILIGEAEIWTLPSYGRVDFKDYNSSFGRAATLHADDARPMGIAMTIHF